MTVTLRDTCRKVLADAGVFPDVDGAPSIETETMLVAEVVRIAGLTAEMARQAMHETMSGILAEMIAEASL